jgi:hypothetical protein
MLVFGRSFSVALRLLFTLKKESARGMYLMVLDSVFALETSR